MSAVQDLLEEIGKEVCDTISGTTKFKDRTGDLRASIGYKVIKNSQGEWRLIFHMLYYGVFVDEGTRTIQARNFFRKEIDEAFVNYTRELAQAAADDAVVLITQNFGRKSLG